MLDPAIAAELTGPDVSGPEGTGTHTAGRGMGKPEPTTVGGPTVGEMVSVGNSVAPGEGPHEPPAEVGGVSYGANRSQTGAAADPGQDIRQSNGETVVPSPDRISGLPMEWADDKMANSQPGFAFRPTLYNPDMSARDFLGRHGSARRAGPGPASQGAADLYRPAPGQPLGQRGPQVVPPGSGGFAGHRVTPGFARRFLGPRRARKRPFPKLPNRRRR